MNFEITKFPLTNRLFDNDNNKHLWSAKYEGFWALYRKTLKNYDLHYTLSNNIMTKKIQLIEQERFELCFASTNWCS